MSRPPRPPPKGGHPRRAPAPPAARPGGAEQRRSDPQRAAPRAVEEPRSIAGPADASRPLEGVPLRPLGKIADVARHLRLSEASVRRLIDQGVIKEGVIRLGRNVRFDLDEIDRSVKKS